LNEYTDIAKLSSVDSLVVAGQSFSDQVFNNLLVADTKPVLKWMPYHTINTVYDPEWKAVLRKGEIQVVSGSIESDGGHQLRLCFAGQTIDSTRLIKGVQRFQLQAPAFVQGQSFFTVNLGEAVLDTIRFFARPTEPLVFQFVQESPDFESRNLATWLGKNGHSVLYTTTLSKDLDSKQTINTTKKEADIIVADPVNASASVVKKALAAGKSVLFINVANPLADIGRINSALGTKFTLKRTSQRESVSVLSGLSAFPYLFTASGRLLSAPGLPVAVEKQKGQVAVSLLNETFPLVLAGDSIAYQKVWNNILAVAHPSLKNNISVRGPLVSGLTADVNLNNFTNLPAPFKIGNDTIYPAKSALNSVSYNASFRPSENGWVSLPDSAKSKVFVEKASSYSEAQLKDFIKSYSAKNSLVSTTDRIRNQPSPWFWLGLLLVCLTAVWVERKL
jgi:hypothetical protein